MTKLDSPEKSVEDVAIEPIVAEKGRLKEITDAQVGAALLKNLITMAKDPSTLFQVVDCPRSSVDVWAKNEINKWMVRMGNEKGIVAEVDYKHAEKKPTFFDPDYRADREDGYVKHVHVRTSTIKCALPDGTVLMMKGNFHDWPNKHSDNSLFLEKFTSNLGMIVGGAKLHTVLQGRIEDTVREKEKKTAQVGKTANEKSADIDMIRKAFGGRMKEKIVGEGPKVADVKGKQEG